MSVEQLIPIIIAIPLVVGIINGIYGRNLSKKIAGSIATIAVFTSFFLAVTVFFQLDQSVRINLFTIIIFTIVIFLHSYKLYINLL